MKKETCTDLRKTNAYGEAYTIIEGYSFLTGALPNGWTIDNRFDTLKTRKGPRNKIVDLSNDSFYSLSRKFDTERDGILRLELLLELASENGGAYVAFRDESGIKVVEIAEENGYMTFKGVSNITSYISIDHSESKQYLMILELDIDRSIASLTVNNEYIGKVNVSSDISVSELVLGTNKKGTGSITLLHAVLDKNYVLSDRFMSTSNLIGQKPSDWSIEGNFKLAYMPSEYYYNVYSVCAESTANSISTATKSFDKIYGKFAFETYVLFPQKVDGASVALTSSGVEILKFETKNDNIVMGDSILHNYTENVWQCLHIDADTATGIAEVYVNGKKRADIRFLSDSFDGVKIEFAPKKDATMWFDDVVLYNLYDHEDYPAYPQVAQSANYNIGVNVCWIWRDSNSGEGWDAASSFPEIEPYIGYYDEGLRETADWEIKYMAEHGIDFMNVCWYCPGHDVNVPIKKMYRSHAALHDGYMYAKYSNLVKFCLLWENDTKGFTSLDQFKKFIWPYWKEYYFTDKRYMRLDGKALITVWNRNLLTSMFGGEEQFKEAVAFMEADLMAIEFPNEDDKFKGLVLLYTTMGGEPYEDYTKYSALGYDGSYVYHYGTSGYDPQMQIEYNRTNAKNALRASSVHVPSVSVGFNSLPRHGTRYPIITAEDHLAVCQDIKNLLATYKTGTWKDNTIIFSTWNEYTEGTYICPTERIGFSYLENIRKTFTDDTSDHSKIDIKPTKEQIRRVSHMYPSNRSSIRRYFLEESEKEAMINDTSQYFSTHNITYGAGIWGDTHNNIIGLTSTKQGICGIGTTTDFGVDVEISKIINAKDAPILHIRMQSNYKGDVEVYYVTSESAFQAFDARRCEKERVTKTDAVIDYYFKLGSHNDWKGNVTKIRIDPNNISGTEFRIELVEFMNYPHEDNDLSVKINHINYSMAFEPKALDDGDYEIVCDRIFYSLMMLHHEWNRVDQTLTIKTADERTLIFKVGSDRALIDGVDIALGYTFKLRDGLPVFKIINLCNMLGYKYFMCDNILNIQSCDDEESESLRKITESKNN
ncbi:MAG: glycoside hydrolase family 99-like domain-containing protein [Clostridia bacterium]|nr:glycoside hydrolase family 99-like domain-containing protein [Clostridia bacterium]